MVKNKAEDGKTVDVATICKVRFGNVFTPNLTNFHQQHAATSGSQPLHCTSRPCIHYKMIMMIIDTP